MILVLDLGQNSQTGEFILQRITGRAKVFQGQDMLPMVTTFWATKSSGKKMKNAHTLEDHMKQTAR